MKGRIERLESDREEELSFFRELKKHQNQHLPSLLLSEDYESDHNYGKFSLYRIPSGRKENGLENLETHKSDFDWLKTPPATPLFPSLEMEPSAKLVIQKELPITQPISRIQFTKIDVESLKLKSNQTNQTKSSKLSMRSITPSHNQQRSNLNKTTNEQQINTHPTTNKTKFPNIQKQTNNVENFLTLNQKKSIESNEAPMKVRTRGVSPLVKSKGSENVIKLSNETPQNLRTDKRSISSTRGRSITRGSIIGGFQNQDPIPKSCRPSRSPSPSMSKNGLNQFDRTQKNVKIQKETLTLASGSNESRSHFKGSKMVEKVVNARKSSIIHVDKETKPKIVKYKV